MCGWSMVEGGDSEVPQAATALGWVSSRQSLWRLYFVTKENRLLQAYTRRGQGSDQGAPEGPPNTRAHLFLSLSSLRSLPSCPPTCTYFLYRSSDDISRLMSGLLMHIHTMYIHTCTYVPCTSTHMYAHLHTHKLGA